MRRLSPRALKILVTEINRVIKDPIESVRRDIILRRLNKLAQQEGAPMSYEEIKAEIQDIFPDFDEKILRKAASANRGPGKLGLIRNVAIGITLAAGGLWVINLPYPMIRWPVSRTAPILLLPSYISMDHSYRQAIALVAQSDQLVNQATSTQDIDLGAEKVTDAQKHLDRLPVWFLGYYPRAYCTLFSCTWRFTYDEFADAREAIGRMEAKIFQEQNAFEQLDQGTAAVDAAKTSYQSAQSEEAKLDAAMAWQAGMDTLNEIPAETLAGRQAQTKLTAYRRDFEAVSGLLAGNNRTNGLIAAAQQFAWSASTQTQNPPHAPAVWEQSAALWQEAIRRLQQIPNEDPGYVEAQTLLAEYQTNLGVIQIRRQAEEDAQVAWQRAEQRHTQLWGNSRDLAPEQYAAELQQIMNDLRRIQEGTTPYPEAQALMQSIEQQLATYADS
jgi:hypothetical protein